MIDKTSPLKDVISELATLNVYLPEELVLILINRPQSMYDLRDIEDFKGYKILGNPKKEDQIEWVKVSILQSKVFEVFQSAQKKAVCILCSTIR
ncbi:MAG: hypothetical protein PHU74_00015 [Candidatus Pacebacteria bacterium]|nr:hypothetical protein [Candidatus Paceibacterota bacterium]